MHELRYYYIIPPGFTNAYYLVSRIPVESEVLIHPLVLVGSSWHALRRDGFNPPT